MATFYSPTNTPLNITEEDAIKYQGGVAGDPYKGLRASGYSDKPASVSKAQVSMIDTGSAISQINKQRSFLDQTYPNLPPLPAQTNQTTTPAKPTSQAGKALFTNQNGQEISFTQDQLKDRNNQRFLQDNGYVMAQSDFAVDKNLTTSGIQNDINDLNGQIEDLTKSMMNLNLDADPEFLAISQSIKNQFAEARNQIEQTNRQRERALTTLGNRYGTTRFGNQVQAGIETEEIKQGAQRVADINAKEAEALVTARQAFKSGKWENFSRVVNSLKDLREEKNTELTAYNQSIANLNKKLQEEEKTIQQQITQASRDSAIAGLVGQGITDAATALDLLNFDENGRQIGDFTLDEVSKAMNLAYNKETLSGLNPDFRTYEYLRQNQPAELQAMGVTSFQGYLKAVNNAQNDFVGDLMNKYPDAGILPEDSFAAAQAKLPNSKIYKQQTRLSSGGSGSGGGGGGGGSRNTFASDLDAIIGNTIATIPTKFGQEQFQAQISRARNDADKISTVASVVLKNQPAEVKRDYSNQAVAIKNIDKAIALLDEKTKTGVINNAAQYTFNLLGKDFDPNLTAINQYIISAIQPYRNSITGAAWGDQEDAEYQQLFGSTKYSPTELKNRLTRLKEIMKDKSVTSLNAFVNPLDVYNNPFSEVSPQQTQNQVTNNASQLNALPAPAQQSFWSKATNWLFGD